jgi:hypothetical protein
MAHCGFGVQNIHVPAVSRNENRPEGRVSGVDH